MMLIMHLSLALAAPIDPSNREIQSVPEAGGELQTDIDLEKRANSQSNPTDAYFDVSGWPDIAEEDCKMMLCDFNGERVW